MVNDDISFISTLMKIYIYSRKQLTREVDHLITILTSSSIELIESYNKAITIEAYISINRLIMLDEN